MLDTLSARRVMPGVGHRRYGVIGAHNPRSYDRPNEPCAVDSFCAAENIEANDLYNRIALIVAERFDNGTLPYQDGDGVMNAIFGMLLDGDKPMESVEPAWSIYLAFDEGEYYHGGSTDPVESFTRPQIRKILDDAQQIVGRERR